MPVKQKNRIRRVVDVCMTVLLLCLMAYQVTGEKAHEWTGMGMTAVLIGIVLFFVFPPSDGQYYSGSDWGRFVGKPV